MRKVIVSEFVTLDGVMEDPGGAEKFEHGGWTMPYWDEEIGKFKFDELFASDALLLGRVTYQGFAAAWPSRTDEAGFADSRKDRLIPTTTWLLTIQYTWRFAIFCSLAKRQFLQRLTNFCSRA